MKPALHEISPIAAMYQEMRAIQPRLVVEIGRPLEATGTSNDGWVNGTDLIDASRGPFHELLLAMGEKLKENDRRTIVASFALRYGWAAGIAIGPYLVHGCVPNINLENTAYKFGGEYSMFEKAALYEPEGVMLASEHTPAHPSIRLVRERAELLYHLRNSLVSQTAPVLNALREWSHFSMRGLWGLITSSWGSQFISVFGKVSKVATVNEAENGISSVKEFFGGNDVVCEMQPEFYPVTYQDVTHVYQRAASCCRFYLRPKKQYCATCPLLSQEVRVKRNLDWTKKRMEVLS